MEYEQDSVAEDCVGLDESGIPDGKAVSDSILTVRRALITQHPLSIACNTSPVLLYTVTCCYEWEVSLMPLDTVCGF